MILSDLLLLCERMQRGDNQAFATLYEECYAPLYRYVYGMTFSKEDSEDIVQETFVRVAKAMGSFKTGNVLSWLFTIARHILYDQSRKKRRTTPLQESHENIGILEDVDSLITKDEQMHLLKKKLQMVTDTEWELLLLKYWQDLDMKQIANIVGKSHDALRKEMSRLIKKLKKNTNE